MAYMHKKTFEIYREIYDMFRPMDYFAVDDLIALPIQVLNRKGYVTTACCAGHPFDRQFQDEPIPNTAPVAYRRVYHSFPCESYIAFHENIVDLPDLPRGFRKDLSFSNSLNIRKTYNYDGVDVYGIVHHIADSMKELYEWTLTLPNYADYRMEKIMERRNST